MANWLLSILWVSAQTLIFHASELWPFHPAKSIASTAFYISPTIVEPLDLSLCGKVSVMHHSTLSLQVLDWIWQVLKQLFNYLCAWVRNHRPHKKLAQTWLKSGPELYSEWSWKLHCEICNFLKKNKRIWTTSVDISRMRSEGVTRLTWVTVWRNDMSELGENLSKAWD